MKHLALTLSLLIVSLSLAAESIDKRLRTHSTPGGTLYFIADKKLSKHDKGIDKFLYDITYVDSRDSATINFSILSASPADVATLTIGNATTRIEAEGVALLYHELHKKKYLIRTTAKVPYAALKPILTSSQPLSFTIGRTDGQTHTAFYSPGQWKSEQALFGRIVYLINK